MGRKGFKSSASGRSETLLQNVGAKAMVWNVLKQQRNGNSLILVLPALKKSIQIKTCLFQIFVKETPGSAHNAGVWKGQRRFLAIKNMENIRHEHMILLRNLRIRLFKLDSKFVNAWGAVTKETGKNTIVVVHWFRENVTQMCTGPTVPLEQKFGYCRMGL